MSSSSITEIIPLQTDSAGVIRIGGTRVTLDTAVDAFCAGAIAEEIVQQYPSLNLADVYHVIGYYLRRTTEVEAYLQAGKAAPKRCVNRTKPASIPKASVRVCSPAALTERGS